MSPRRSELWGRIERAMMDMQKASIDFVVAMTELVDVAEDGPDKDELKAGLGDMIDTVAEASETVFGLLGDDEST